MNVMTCYKCARFCACHNDLHCLDCAIEPCVYCGKMWCKQGNDKHVVEHRRHFILTYMVLALHCNRLVIEAVGHATKINKYT